MTFLAFAPRSHHDTLRHRRPINGESFKAYVKQFPTLKWTTSARLTPRTQRFARSHYRTGIAAILTVLILACRPMQSLAA
jgi:hypothetical protein